MGTIAARKAASILENVKNVIAIEYMCSAQGIDLLAPLKASDPLEAAKSTIRKVVPKLEDDRTLTPDIEKIRSLMDTSNIIAAAETKTGPLLDV